MASGKKLIAEADKQIDALKASTKNATAETKAANEKNMKELQEKKKAAQAELAKLEKSGADVWDATKTGFSKADSASSTHSALGRGRVLSSAARPFSR